MQLLSAAKISTAQKWPIDPSRTASMGGYSLTTEQARRGT